MYSTLFYSLSIYTYIYIYIYIYVDRVNDKSTCAPRDRRTYLPRVITDVKLDVTGILRPDDFSLATVWTSLMISGARGISFIFEQDVPGHYSRSCEIYLTAWEPGWTSFRCSATFSREVFFLNKWVKNFFSLARFFTTKDLKLWTILKQMFEMVQLFSKKLFGQV